MKGLPTLIRLRRQELDERRRLLVELEQEEAALVRQIQELDDQVTRERAFAGQAEEVRFSLENFASAAKIRRENLVDALTGLQEPLETARNGVSEAFQEFKKLDIAEENDQRRQAEEIERRDRIAADEISLEIHRRANQ